MSLKIYAHYQALARSLNKVVAFSDLPLHSAGKDRMHGIVSEITA
jgi:hypothetical protein